SAYMRMMVVTAEENVEGGTGDLVEAHAGQTVKSQGRILRDTKSTTVLTEEDRYYRLRHQSEISSPTMDRSIELSRAETACKIGHIEYLSNGRSCRVVMNSDFELSRTTGQYEEKLFESKLDLRRHPEYPSAPRDRITVATVVEDESAAAID
ncbi:hypothetical protein FOZ63_016034, partial [Perkinsus olseni]